MDGGHTGPGEPATDWLEIGHPGLTLLPNTSGARSAEEALRVARLAREI